MEKQAFLPALAMRAAGAVVGKALPKALTAGYKGLIRPMARMAFKRPGMALTGAMMPSWIGGYANAAREKGLSSLPRSLPKFASTQGEEMSDKKYPSIFYKIEGFEKMAAESEAAHRLVKKAFLGNLLKSITGIGQKSTFSVVKEELGKALAKEVAESSADIPKLIAVYKNNLGLAAKELKPKGLRELFATLRSGSPLIGAAAVGVPAYFYGSKAIKGYRENKEIDTSFANMLRIYPELGRESPQNTRQYFNYIKQYSPTVAKNPHAAGAIVKRFTSTGGMAMDNSVIKSLLEVEKTKGDAERRSQGILGTLGDLI